MISYGLLLSSNLRLVSSKLIYGSEDIVVFVVFIKLYILSQVKVKMKNLTNDNEWLWDKNKFINRKYIMQEMYQNYTEGDELNVDKVKFLLLLF